MHPNSAFRHDDRALDIDLIEQVGFGMVFLTTPDGPRAAHTPLLMTSSSTARFHLARGNALTRHLAGATALALVNGPDAYVSPRWYADPAQVPTWNYVSLELEGLVRQVDRQGLHAMLEALSARQEARMVQGTAWTMDKMPPVRLAQMMDSIVGFELEIKAWRPTFKLSQNKPAEERARAIAGLEAEGSLAMATLMRTFAK